MSKQKGLAQMVTLNKELAEMLGATQMPRTEVTKKLWDYIKSNKLQTSTENGKPEGNGSFIVADKTLLPVFRKTHSTSKAGNVTDLRNLKEGETIGMMQVASVIGANVEKT